MAPVTSTTNPSKPTFPSYLLPSFKLPFRHGHRRQTTTSLVSDVPSLSSSLSSSVSSLPAGSPPSSLPPYFDSVNYQNRGHGHGHSQGQQDRNKPLGDGVATPPIIPNRSPTRRLSRVSPNTLRCSTCSSDMAFSAQIVSKGFTGRQGRAYLVSPPSPPAADEYVDQQPLSRNLLNVRVGRPESRQLVTGWHVVADISCAVCGSKVGWKYVDAHEPEQQYKVGKFILETERVAGFRSWEDVHVDLGVGEDWQGARAAGGEEDDGRGTSVGNGGLDGGNDGEGAEEVVFNSEDEDECEDIFMGTWDPVVVAERRSKKVSRMRRH